MNNNFQQLLKPSFKPYTWPNPAFPFREYYKSSKCRIFIIENLSHNWLWLKEYRDYIKDSDYFFIIQGCIYKNVFNTDKIVFNYLDLNVENFYYMCNSEDDVESVEKNNFYGELLNHNMWIDYTKFNIQPLEKIYNAVYTARLISLKRHYLASKVNNLALIVGNDPCHSKEKITPPKHSYMNKSHLKPEEVIKILNQSKCGLILSKEEGACFSSSEYLLCGIQVVSTRSKGGRDVWYDNSNSIICEDNKESVRDCVEKIIKMRCNPLEIRNKHIEQSNFFRKRFILQLDKVFKRFGETTIDAEDYFYQNYFHKIRVSYKPDFEKIFKQ
jgi:glycosyltransferase involved in cell wall biosynthesis